MMMQVMKYVTILVQVMMQAMGDGDVCDRYPVLVLGIHSKDFQIHLFFHFSHDLSYISPFFFMSNEIILFQTLCMFPKYLLISLMKVKIVKFIQCGACSINGPKFPKI